MTDSTRQAEDVVRQPSDNGLAAELRGFGPIGIAAMLLILLTGNVFVGSIVLPVGAALVLLWARWSETPWRELGLVRPKSWIVTIVAGIAFGAAFKLVMKALVMPLLGADPVNQAFRHWTGNAAAMPAAIWAMFVAGFGEETLFRGYLFERSRKVRGTGALPKALTVLITSLWFGLGHLSAQGLSGGEQALIVGLVYGTFAAVTGRIVPLMIAHTAFDLTALALIYWNLEATVAHFIFK
jgi:membrane protease YdiL (CAAX protease family)